VSRNNTRANWVQCQTFAKRARFDLSEGCPSGLCALKKGSCKARAFRQRPDERLQECASPYVYQSCAYGSDAPSTALDQARASDEKPRAKPGDLLRFVQLRIGH
jgi:hypothetical protein